FILFPMSIGYNLVIANLANIGLHLLFGASLVRYALARARPFRVALFSLAFALTYWYSLQADYKLILVVVLLLTTFSEERTTSRLALAIAGCLSAAFFFVKISVGLTTLSVLLAVAAIAIYQRRPRSLSAAAGAAVAYAVTMLLIAA